MKFHRDNLLKKVGKGKRNEQPTLKTADMQSSTHKPMLKFAKEMVSSIAPSESDTLGIKKNSIPNKNF